jgi:acetyl-CoA carboxylase carboxyl transferase subunit alpha
MSATSQDALEALKTVERRIEFVERQIAKERRIDKAEYATLLEMRDRETERLFEVLDPMGHVLVARHSKRPHSIDYIRSVFNGFTEFHGGGSNTDDPAIICGIAQLNSEPVMIIAQEKGRDAAEKHYRNSGVANADGYRKALFNMQRAAKFNRPIICLIDTAGAQANRESEAAGISKAIAHNIREMFYFPVPIVVAVIGEGGSGGALGIGIGDRILMLQYTYYSVISPEGCANILFNDEARAAEAAANLNPTATKALELGIVDEIVPEPLGSAYRDPAAAARNLKEALVRHLSELRLIPPDVLLRQRYRRYRHIGQYTEIGLSPS